jgi:hypothetical protein
MRRKTIKGLLVPRKGRAEHLKVSEAHLPRALSILEALFRALEERKVQVVWPKDGETNLSLVCDSEKIGLCFSEIVDSKPHIVTAEEETHKKRLAVVAAKARLPTDRAVADLAALRRKDFRALHLVGRKEEADRGMFGRDCRFHRTARAGD